MTKIVQSFVFILTLVFVLLTGCKKPQETQKSVDLSQLKGKWQMSTGEKITIEDSIFYPPSPKKYRYETKDDTLLYIYFDMPDDSTGKIMEFGIRKLNKDEMEIDNGSDKTITYTRIPN